MHLRRPRTMRSPSFILRWRRDHIIQAFFSCFSRRSRESSNQENFSKTCDMNIEIFLYKFKIRRLGPIVNYLKRYFIYLLFFAVCVHAWCGIVKKEWLISYFEIREGMDKISFLSIRNSSTFLTYQITYYNSIYRLRQKKYLENSY
jgi:hypothetical protein